MSIQSLGVGSGLALDDLVTQLIQVEREPRERRLNDTEEQLDAELSAVGQLKSRLSDFRDSVDELRNDFNLTGREPTISNPDETVEPFTAEASNSALEGSYEIAIEQLASGSRIETADALSGGYSSTTDTVLSSGTGSLTFKIDSTGDSFNISLSAGTTLSDLANLINSNDNNFGVTASIIDTGTTDGGARLVFTSDTTGQGNDLVIVNDNDLAELDLVSTTDSTETNTYLSAVKSAQNAKASIDGIAVESSTNEFENTIANVEFIASEVSTLASDGITFETSTLQIGNDTEGLESKIRDFIDKYNTLATEIDTLTRYGQSDLEEDGALAGDFMARGISSGLSNIIASSVSNSELGSLFQIGVSIDDDGKLEISSFDEFGFGSGEDRLADALENYFDEVAVLFTDEDEGVANRLYDYVNEYTTFDGLLASRETSIKDQQDQLLDDREAFELRMLNFEQTLRDRYVNLDLTVASLNSTGSALVASLSAI